MKLGYLLLIVIGIIIYLIYSYHAIRFFRKDFDVKKGEEYVPWFVLTFFGGMYLIFWQLIPWLNQWEI